MEQVVFFVILAGGLVALLVARRAKSRPPQAAARGRDPAEERAASQSLTRNAETRIGATFRQYVEGLAPTDHLPDFSAPIVRDTDPRYSVKVRGSAESVASALLAEYKSMKQSQDPEAPRAATAIREMVWAGAGSCSYKWGVNRFSWQVFRTTSEWLLVHVWEDSVYRDPSEAQDEWREFTACPNCGSRASQRNRQTRVLRCRACSGVYCDLCERDSGLKGYCPHCGAAVPVPIGVMQT